MHHPQQLGNQYSISHPLKLTISPTAYQTKHKLTNQLNPPDVRNLNIGTKCQDLNTSNQYLNQRGGLKDNQHQIKNHQIYRSQVLTDHRNKENINSFIKVFEPDQKTTLQYQEDRQRLQNQNQKLNYRNLYSLNNSQHDNPSETNNILPKFLQLNDELNNLKTEFINVKQQKTALAQKYNDLVQKSDRQQKDFQNLQDEFKQMSSDKLQNEQYRQELLNHIEHQRITILNTQKEQSVQQQTQVLDLEQDNHNLKQELNQIRRSLVPQDQEIDYSTVYGYGIASQSQNNFDKPIDCNNNKDTQVLQFESQTLINIGENLIREAQYQNNQFGLDLPRFQVPIDSDIDQITKWRNFMLQKYTYECKQIELESKRPCTYKTNQQQPLSAYKKLNMMMIETAGLMRFKLNYKIEDTTSSKFNQIEKETLNIVR